MTKIGRPIKHFNLFIKGEFVGKGSINQLSELSGINPTTLAHSSSISAKTRELVHIGTEYQSYRLHQKGKHIMDAPIWGLTEYLEMKESSIRYYMSVADTDEYSDIHITKLDETIYISAEKEDNEPPVVDQRPERELIIISSGGQKVWRPSTHTRLIFNMTFSKWGVRA